MYDRKRIGQPNVWTIDCGHQNKLLLHIFCIGWVISYEKKYETRLRSYIETEKITLKNKKYYKIQGHRSNETINAIACNTYYFI